MVLGDRTDPLAPSRLERHTGLADIARALGGEARPFGPESDQSRRKTILAGLVACGQHGDGLVAHKAGDDRVLLFHGLALGRDEKSLHTLFAEYVAAVLGHDGR